MAMRCIGRVPVELPCLAEQIAQCQIPQCEAVGRRVKASFVASDRTSGALRVWRDLLAEGVNCGLHRIERLMRLQAFRARPRRRSRRSLSMRFERANRISIF